MDNDNSVNIDTDIINERQQQTSQPHPSDISWMPPPRKSEYLSGLYDLYTDDEGLWVVYRWEDSADARIELFYNRWLPSRTSARGCAWISVNRGLSPYMKNLPREEHDQKFRMDVEGLKTEFAKIVESGEVKVTPELIDGLAVKYGVLSGKWLVYGNSEDIDQLWRKVVCAVTTDRGHGQLKVSARKIQDAEQPLRKNAEGIPIWDGGVTASGKRHVICVYVEDYLNKRDVDELRKALRFRAGVFWPIGFKPDVYTYLGIYKGNSWGMRPIRYHDHDYRKGGGGF